MAIPAAGLAQGMANAVAAVAVIVPIAANGVLPRHGARGAAQTREPTAAIRTVTAGVSVRHAATVLAEAPAMAQPAAMPWLVPTAP
jgi:hypothetical protein